MTKNLFIFAGWLAIFVILGFFLTIVTTSCYEGQQKPDATKEKTIHKLLLPDIVAETGEAVDLTAELRTAKGALWKGKCPDDSSKSGGAQYAPPDKDRIAVLNVTATIPPTVLDPFRKRRQCLIVSGEFLANESLKPHQGEWNGKKEGAAHVLNGKIAMFDYVFDSDPEDPLMFKMTPKGYQYLRGKGRVEHTKTGKSYFLKTKPEDGPPISIRQRGERRSLNLALIQAAEEGWEHEARKSLASGADCNAKDYVGNTALHYAVENSRTALVKLLLEHRADVNARNRDGDTPLKIGGQKLQNEIKSLLLQYGAKE